MTTVTGLRGGHLLAGERFTLRRPSAGYADLSTAWMRPIGTATVPTPRGAIAGWEWSLTDLLLIPLALWLAAGWTPGEHRRGGRTTGGHRRPAGIPARTVAGRVIRSHRRTRTGGTTK